MGNMFKSLLATALVAAVKAEADPFYLGGYAYGLPVGHPSGADPITQGLDASTQGYAPYGYGHFGYYYGKRSADPYYLGGYAALPYAAHGVVAAAVPFGSSTGLDPITQGLDASTQGYAPYAYGYGLGYYGKRDADADPALLYGGYAGYPYAYGVPFGSSTGL